MVGPQEVQILGLLKLRLSGLNRRLDCNSRTALILKLPS